MTSRSPREMRELVHDICLITARAGAKALDYYQRGTTVSYKSDSSPLTEADRASHALLVAALAEQAPGVPVISEESAPSDQTLENPDATFWLVDPLDGTKEFLKGTGEFTVNVALVEQGQPTLGVVYAPVLERTFFADRHTGAFRQDGKQPPVQIHAKGADFSKLRVVASKDHAGPMVAAMLAQLRNPELKSMGSSLKFCLVAEGAADVYLRDVPTMEWDTAAAQCVVEAAGGVVLTLEGEPLRYGKAGLKNPSLITVGDPALPWKTWLMPHAQGAT